MSTVPVVRPGWPTAGPPQQQQQQFQQGQQPWPAYSYPAAGGQRVAGTRKLGHHHVLAGLLGVLVGLGAVFAVIGVVAPPSKPTTCTTTACLSEPPTGIPVQNWPVYKNAKYGFAVTIVNVAPGIKASQSDANNQLTVNYSEGSTQFGYLQVAGVPDQNGSQTAEQVVDSIVNNNASGAQLAYVIPGAMVGYQPGYGAAYDFTGNSGDGSNQTQRIIVMAAVRNGLAIVTFCVGVKVAFGDGKGQIDLTDHHTSIADSLPALFGDPTVNSIQWPGQTTP
ncbi:MAG: hypothetical protein WAM97_22625 [Acidimicrobiales bacterium]|jgi:hypothetical protein